MKKNDLYKDSVIICSCGEKINTKSTNSEINVEVCSSCHPYYTGKQTRNSKDGRVEKFNKKYGFESKKSE